MSRFDEIEALRAIVAMPFMARLLRPELFGCHRMRAAFEHMAAGQSVWTMEGPAREALIEGDLWDRARAWESTIESACWWWPHNQFIIVSERPLEIHREQVGEHGWGSHRLHNDTGAAVKFRGWEVKFNCFVSSNA